MAETNSVNSVSYVVGIGASAGGLRALEEFFENMPPDSGASFVVIQHLSPDFKSMMEELLERRTNMEVHLAIDGLGLKPNSIYLIPPGKNLVVRDRKLHLVDQDRQQGSKHPHFPIDIFFHSLALEYQSKAIAVVLSGTGSDGSHGLTAINEQGGVAMVQDPNTAEFDGMPQSALQTGVVDRVLAPRDLARVIYEFVRSPLEILQPKTENQLDLKNEGFVDAYALQRITKLLAENSRVDFAHYKPTTLCRRIQRRCLLAGYNNLEAYIQYLQQSDQERTILHTELLISVTRFFRDQEAWAYLEAEVLPELFDNKNENGLLRFWVTACATGEEAYSLAILLHELREKMQSSVKIKIFATDVDTVALERASLGRYPLSIANDVSKERLQTYFTSRDQGYEVSRHLREMMIFSEHNLIRDAVFPRMNLISCRNVLIYLQPSLQRRVLQNLHFALGPKGKLFLGESETLGNLAAEFNTLQHKWKIFEKIRDVRLPDLVSQVYAERSEVRPYFFSSTTGRQPQFDPLIEKAFKEFVIDNQATCLLIDRNNQLLHIVADALKLLELPSGRVTYDIVHLLPEPLRLPLNTALHRARQINETVEFTGIKLLGDVHNDKNIHLQARLYQPGGMIRDFLLVTIHEQESISRLKPIVPAFQADDVVASHVMQLEYELQQTRENLQATIEELETTNEEQQASNEELIASNEELQSTNEELHSVNEELHTVNAEYQTKIDQLIELNADLDNLLQNTQIGVIFLDSNLKIRKFTSTVTPIIPLRDSDIGRSLQDLVINIECPDCSNLPHLIREVEEQKQSLFREVKLTGSENYFMLKIHPYLIDQNTTKGTVLIFVDIDEIKKAEARVKNANIILEQKVKERTKKLQELNKRYQLIFQGSNAGLLYWDIIGDHAEVSPQCAAIFGYDADAKEIASFTEFQKLIHPDDLPKVRTKVTNHLEKKVPYSIEYRVHHKQGHNIWISSSGQAIWDKNNCPTFMSLSFQDITDRKLAQLELEELNKRYQLVFQGSQAGLLYWDIVNDYTEISSRCAEILGYNPQEITTISFEEFKQRIHPEDLSKVEAAVKDHLETKVPYKIEYRYLHEDGHYVYLYVTGQAVWDENNRPKFMGISMQDISDRKQQEVKLKENIVELEQLSCAKDEFLASMSHELRTPLNAILGLSEALQEGVFGSISEEQQGHLSTIYDSGSHLLLLINDILDTAKIETGKLDLNKNVADIRNLCESTIRLVEQQTKQKEIKLEAKLPEFLPNIPLDERRIRQCLLNFLSNAIKFTQEGGSICLGAKVLSPVKEINTVIENNILRLFVTDTGIGISPENQGKLFKPFSQVDSKLNRQYEGSGLGLYLTKQIVELHGGTVGFSSKIGRGSSFWLNLPFEIQEQLDQDQDTSVNNSSQYTNIIKVKRDKPLILLVEDNPANVLAMSSYLEIKGYQLVFAENGREAISQTQVHKPDIILMDIQMPIMNGFEAIEQIRQLPDFDFTPIIALTALAMNEDKINCLEAGANDYISKPVKMKELVDKIQNLIETN